MSGDGLHLHNQVELTRWKYRAAPAETRAGCASGDRPRVVAISGSYGGLVVQVETVPMGYQ